jgi:hypothetical protein
MPIKVYIHSAKRTHGDHTIWAHTTLLQQAGHSFSTTAEAIQLVGNFYGREHAFGFGTLIP